MYKMPDESWRDYTYYREKGWFDVEKCKQIAFLIVRIYPMCPAFAQMENKIPENH